MQKHETREGITNAMVAKRQFSKKSGARNKSDQEWINDSKTQNAAKKETFKHKCHRCRKVGHKAAEYTERIKNTDDANVADNLSLCTTTNITFINKSDDLDTHESSIREIWCVDSGCTAHMCGNDVSFVDYDESTVGKVNLAGKSSIDVKGRGLISLTANFDNQTKNININDILHVLELLTNLLSVGRLCDKRFKVIFEADGATVIDRDGKATLRADRIKSGLYYLRTTPIETNANAELNGGTNAKLSSDEI